MWSYGQCGENIRSIVLQLNTMYSSMVDVLLNDDIYQTIINALPKDLVSAIKATSLILCVMFFLIDFFTKTLHLQWVTWENVLMLMLKLVAAKVCVDNSEVFATTIYKGFNSFVAAIDGTTLKYHFIDTSEGWSNIYTYFVTRSEATQISANTSAGFLNFQPLLLNLQITIQGLVMKLTLIVATVIVIARLFELSIYTIVMPIPLSTFACDGLSDVGKNFLKSFAAVVIQSMVLAVMFIAYAAINKVIIDLVVSNLAATDVGGIMGFITSITLAVGIMQSGTWAKRICGAM